MADIVDKQTRSRMMSGIRGKDTKPEMVLRRALHAGGFRYRLHGKGVPGRPDMILAKHRAVIFVHGCFWHQHLDPGCKLARLPKSKLDFWGPKLETNRERDERNLVLLAELGWDVLVIWECQTKNREELQARIGEFLG